MADFTVVISTADDMSINQIGEILNMIETRGVVIEEIFPDRLVSDEGETYWASEMDEYEDD